MPVISRLIVTQSDPRVCAGLRFEFERRGATVDVLQDVDGIEDLLGDADDDNPPQLIIAGAGSRPEAIQLISCLQDAMGRGNRSVPLLYYGNAISRDEAFDAGASEFLSGPTFVRDVVTVAQLLVSPKRNSSTAFRGDLNDYDGVFYIVRAMSAARRSAVLSMVRGLRRGELRFFEGEVTSAQVGMLHGLAALHQLLLWTQASFELRNEEIVRRQQIPMKPSELMLDAQRFLAEIRAVANELQPWGIYVPVIEKLKANPVPAAVKGVVQLMDGYRNIADVIEDSPFRVFDTLRIANRLAAYGLIEHMERPMSSGQSHPALMVDEWLVSTESSFGSNPFAGMDDDDEDGDGDEETGSNGAPKIDWSGFLPASLSSDDAVAQVVPATVAAGEITVPDQTPSQARAEIRVEVDADDDAETDDDLDDDAEVDAEPDDDDDDDDREGLESMTDPEARDRLFSTSTSRPRSTSGEITIPTPDDDEAPAPGGPEDADEPDDEPPVRSSDSDAELTAKPEDRPESATADAPTSEPPERGETDASPGRRAGDKPEFTNDEQAFFVEGDGLADQPRPPTESFDDLDEGYEPQTFWQRLWGNKRKQADPARAPRKSTQPANEPAARERSSDKSETSSEPAPDKSAPDKSAPDKSAPDKSAPDKSPDSAADSASKPASSDAEKPTADRERSEQRVGKSPPRSGGSDKKSNKKRKRKR